MHRSLGFLLTISLLTLAACKQRSSEVVAVEPPHAPQTEHERATGTTTSIATTDAGVMTPASDEESKQIVRYASETLGAKCPDAWEEFGNGRVVQAVQTALERTGRPKMTPEQVEQISVAVGRTREEFLDHCRSLFADTAGKCIRGEYGEQFQPASKCITLMGKTMLPKVGYLMCAGAKDKSVGQSCIAGLALDDGHQKLLEGVPNFGSSEPGKGSNSGLAARSDAGVDNDAGPTAGVGGDRDSMGSDKQTLDEAIKQALPWMVDVNQDRDGIYSKGTTLLTVWATEHMQWGDVGVKRSETTFGRVQKDSEEERGKRLCTSGTLVQIEAIRPATGKFYYGILNGYDGLYQITAVGSSGSLEQGSYARFCGVVTGNLEYNNSGGGTSHAVVLVGMFDLKENRHGAKSARREPATAASTQE